ncbi:histidinol-phosphate transaminase [Chryseotalea sanaruensis]|uniref:Histidinol-phosphate aminotransferase n=1 Tax=Chryseotalea sanaruensis TaxID=2482724 RepID=A0A401U9B2_9BACT|nr:histidinol-phosphate transaminase [Chryseotalea sanaruensis]GCC51486.1 histidinol-phosphate transaminase [Chryseotalea sanaruensis]
MQNFDLNTLVRKNIIALKPYSSARDEFKGEAEVYLDANENPYPSGYNRYPDPLQWKVKELLAQQKEVKAEQIFLGNGSDEAIDLLIRVFCEPNQDSVMITEPTYGMYRVCANINAVAIQNVLLTKDYQLDTEGILKAVTPNTKIIFLCSPNNPTGNLLSVDDISKVLNNFSGLVVVDEAYIDFAGDVSLIKELKKYPNLVILQTFSKAWGLAGLRLGMCFASEAIINLLNKVKYPYNVNIKTQELAAEALLNADSKDRAVAEILSERGQLVDTLNQIPFVIKVYPSDANFVLVAIENASVTYQKLMQQGIIVRDRSTVVLCESSLRITIGTPEENKKLINSLKQI